MQTLTYFIALSIDGFIAGPHDEVDFFEGSDDYMGWMAAEYADALPSTCASSSVSTRQS